MNKDLRLLCIWGALAVGVLVVSVLPSATSFDPFSAAYWTDKWTHFLAYALVTSIPCTASRTKRSVLFCLAVVAFCALCELLSTMAGRPAHGPENVVSDFFGIAAGILLGLNLRYSRSSGEIRNGVPQGERRPTML